MFDEVVFIFQSFDKHLYNFSHKAEKCGWQKNSTFYKTVKQPLLSINSETTRSFKDLKSTEDEWKMGTGISASQGSNTVPTRWAPALQLRSIHGLSKDHAKWIPTLQPHPIFDSNTVSSSKGTDTSNWQEVKMTKKRKAEIDLSWEYCIRW